MQCYFIDKEFGKVVVTLRRGMKNVRCRWRGNRLYMSAPYGMEKQLEGLVDADRDKKELERYKSKICLNGQFFAFLQPISIYWWV